MLSNSRQKREQLLTSKPAPGADTCFATCPRGLEALLADELLAAGATAPVTTPGGVAFHASPEACYRANLESRFATRVLRRVAFSHYRNEQQVYEAAYDVPWQRYFDPSRSIRVDLNAARAPLKSLDFTTLRIKDAVCDRFRAEAGRRPDVDTRTPDVRVHAFLDAENVSLYVDTSGDPLYKRGYREHAAEAPLRENLAAGIIALTGWQPDEPLLDPMCGSGTLLIEAAMRALDIAPGLGRSFGFERLADFDAKLWEKVRERALKAQRRERPLALFGSDQLGREIEGARRNVAAAGLAEKIQLKQAQATDLRPPGGMKSGVMVMNPPYGVRLGEQDELRALYPAIGDWLKKHFAGWRCHIFSGDTELPKLIHLKASRRTPLFNGPIECRLYEYRLVEGSNRDKRRED
jgi:putative N6-adenine-specific DNA methylase